MNPYYLEVFEREDGVGGFFTTKKGACDGSPFRNETVFDLAGAGGLQRIWPKQVHKDHIEVIREKGTSPVTLPDTDGVITDVPGVLLTTVHADCLPVYFYDPEKKAIGLVHGGWRGTAAGIAPKAAAAMHREYGSDFSDLRVFIGPGISRCCFETGADVYDAFAEDWPFISDYADKKGEKYYIDLKGITERQLLDIGVKRIEKAVTVPAASRSFFALTAERAARKCASARGCG